MKNKWWENNVDSDISDVIIELKATLSNKKITKNWVDDLTLNYENLDRDMEDIPTVLAFWSAVLAESRKQRGLIKMRMDIRRSKVLDGTKELIKEGVKLTVSDKENIVCVDPKYMTLQAQEIELEATISKLFGIVDALKIKADNLRSFAAMKRAELHNT